jgi:hypothetical protein
MSYELLLGTLPYDFGCETEKTTGLACQALFGTIFIATLGVPPVVVGHDVSGR